MTDDPFKIPEPCPEGLTPVLLLLPECVVARLTLGADELGLPVGTFCQVILGKAAKSTEWVTAPNRTGSIFESLPENWAEELMHFYRMFSMAGGTSTCNHCTQRLSVESVQNGVCEHCEGEL